MASNYWIKLYHEMLDDPKVGRLSDSEFRLMINLFLLAGDYEQDGYLPNREDIKWRLRNPDDFDKNLDSLIENNIIGEDDGSLLVINFAERQSAMTATERTHRRRERLQKKDYYGNDNETKRFNDKNENGIDIDIDKDIDKIKNREDKDKIGAEKSAEPHYEPCTEDGEPIKEKKKRKSKADPRTSHPAIKSIRRLTGHYPPKVNYDSVIEILGDTPDEQKMAESYREWCERGYNTNSLKWLTDWYVNGVHDKRSGKVNANDVVKEMMEEK